VLLIPFIAAHVCKPVEHLLIEDVTAEHVRLFLQDVEQRRRCSVTTRNQRLAVIHALARFIGQQSAEYIAWCGQLRAIPFKKAAQTAITYLEKAEMEALLAAPDRSTA
jgi:site-specific recombinase XerD